MSLSFDQHAILELFNLDPSKIKDIQFHNDFGSTIVDVLLRPDYPACHDCGNTKVVIKEYQLKKIKHSLLSDRSCILRYHISATSATSIFDTHVQESRRILPELMCWDEAYAFHHIDLNSKYVFTILDFISQEPCDNSSKQKERVPTSLFLKHTDRGKNEGTDDSHRHVCGVSCHHTFYLSKGSPLCRPLPRQPGTFSQGR